MIAVNANRCPQNHRCPTLRVCPTGALQQEGFNAPFIDQDLCIGCGKCTYSCPVFSQVGDETAAPRNGHCRGSNGHSIPTNAVAGFLHRLQR